MLRTVCTAIAATMLIASPAAAESKLLKEIVSFTGAVLHYQLKVPGLVFGVVKDGDIVVVGYGEHRDGSGTAPDGDTVMRIGSITKAFTGAALASLVADGTVTLADRLDTHLDWDVEVPSQDGLPIRLIHLATHTSGLPREIEREAAPDNDPFATVTREAMARNLAADDPLLFAPGTSGLYSNFAFDLLAQALGQADGQPYEALLRSRVLEPAGLNATGFAPAPGRTVMQGHGFDGEPLPDVPTPEMIQGAGGLFASANDILGWLDWHLDRFAEENAAMRLIDHAAYVPRDALETLYGFDESGRMGAMGLGWVVMYGNDVRPTILQKAGGLQGVFAYTAFAPAHGVGAFVAINQFDFSAAMSMAEVVNDLIADLASGPTTPAATAAAAGEPEQASFVFRCEGLGPVPARFGERDVELTLPDGVVALPQLPSGSGARYGNQTIEFWNKGDEATLTRTIAAGSVEHACRED